MYTVHELIQRDLIDENVLTLLKKAQMSRQEAERWKNSSGQLILVLQIQEAIVGLAVVSYESKKNPITHDIVESQRTVQTIVMLSEDDVDELQKMIDALVNPLSNARHAATITFKDVPPCFDPHWITSRGFSTEDGRVFYKEGWSSTSN